MKPVILIIILLFFSLGFIFWLNVDFSRNLQARTLIEENHIIRKDAAGLDFREGVLSKGTGKPSDSSGSFPQFRGKNRDGIVSDHRNIAVSWPESGPKVLWKTETGEGHAGAVIHYGRVIFLDYDEEGKADVVRCLSLESGEEIWSYSYPVKLKRNHGMSRTVPVIDGDYVVTIGPKGHVHCLKWDTGELVWRMDLVADYETKIPEWYSGQCPLIDSVQVILAPGGKKLMIGVDLPTGKIAWECDNPGDAGMTHSSIMPIDFYGETHYVWCSTTGVYAVSATSHEILWSIPEWTIKVATVPSPVDLGEGRIFITGGYSSGGILVQLKRESEKVVPEIIKRTKAGYFASDLQTPVYYEDHLYSVIPGGKLGCMTRDGEQTWVHRDSNFGLGPYLLIGGRLLILDDDQKNPGQLLLGEISPEGFRKVSGHSIIEDRDAWGPMAAADGKLVLRDSTNLFCLDMGGDH